MCMDVDTVYQNSETLVYQLPDNKEKKKKKKKRKETLKKKSDEPKENII